MKSSRHLFLEIFIAVIVSAMSIQVVFASKPSEKLSTEEIIAKHLASIGSETSPQICDIDNEFGERPALLLKDEVP